ncbi:phosphatase PAP2 family protein [Sinomicrobium soli]|uniref:phosphatase PAP2 family protein n=1 Tax=Sinomicrobium sp. N-1-3-6 TaxID=2219864 RepID=UPI000DCB5E59|nr:phosphatase PAP2 family protein [Sinomicrobium sp. N-1-3-6]RAV29784.1 phosphatase PAP2 family protein [Sinomicrobium sp. N-1-3-6]
MWDRLIAYDREIFLLLNNLGTEGWDGFWLFITDKLASLPLYLLLLYMCVRKLGWRSTVWVLVTTALMITCTDQLANVFKDGFQRLRPCHDPLLRDSMRILKCGGKFGYFSAHAASTFAVATFFSLLLKRYYRFLPPVLLLWASVVSYSRIYLGVHFPGDVLTGLFFGVLTGGVLFLLLKQLLHKFAGKPLR